MSQPMLLAQVEQVEAQLGQPLPADYREAYSAAGRIHSYQQTTNRKEYVICLAFPYF